LPGGRLTLPITSSSGLPLDTFFVSLNGICIFYPVDDMRDKKLSGSVFENGRLHFENGRLHFTKWPPAF
jgi:hypothetical protein